MKTLLKNWIPIVEAAELVGCTGRTIHRWADAGFVRKIEVTPKLFLVHRADVEKYAAQPQNQGRPRGS